MPDDANGNYSRPPAPLPVTGQGADAPQVNVPIDDIAAAMSRRYMRDGRAPMLGNIPMNGYRATNAGNAVDPQDLVTLAQVQSLIASIGAVPTGALIPLTGSVVPASWVIANGQTLLRATYPTYWTWIQASGNLAATEGAKTAGQYGPGDGSTTFTVPNLYADNGYFIRPMASGRTIGSVQADEIKAHNHTGTALPAGSHRHGYIGSAGNTVRPNGSNSEVPTPVGATETDFAGEHPHTLAINNTGGTETRPKNIAYPVLIKT